jgi:hypothetical protein
MPLLIFSWGNLMRVFRSPLLAAVMLVMCLAGCQSHTGAPSSVPEWLLVWSPPAKGIDASVPLDRAFEMGTILEHWSTPAPLPASAATWLVIGKTLGIGRVQLDAGDSYQDLVLFYVNSQQNTWDENATSIVSGQPCSDGSKVSGSLVFPEPVCSNGLLTGLNQPFGYALTTWYSASHVYVLVRAAAQLHNADTDGVPVQLGAFTGQMRQAGDFTTILVPIDTNDSMLIASSAGNENTLQLAQTMVAQRDNLVPLQG